MGFRNQLNSLQSSPALRGKGMVQSANAWLFLTEEKLLQFQLHLRAGNGALGVHIGEKQDQSTHLTVSTRSTLDVNGLATE